MLPTLDNHDPRIRYVPLRMERSKDDLPSHSLPEGFSFRFYREGDRDLWIEIEKSAREFDTFEEGVTAWQRYYGGREAELGERMLFLMDATDREIGTATAFYDVPDGDPSGDGWLHWVAIRREAQGQGLAKPLVARALQRLNELGYRRFIVPTQTTTWVACKVYLDLGFRPTQESARENGLGWRIVRRLTDHPALHAFPPASEEEVLVQGGADV